MIRNFKEIIENIKSETCPFCDIKTNLVIDGIFEGSITDGEKIISKRIDYKHYAANCLKTFTVEQSLNKYYTIYFKFLNKYHIRIFNHLIVVSDEKFHPLIQSKDLYFDFKNSTKMLNKINNYILFE